MQKVTKTIVYLDGVEVRDIIAAHLRKEAVLPNAAKFTMKMHTSGEPGEEDIEIKDRGDVRVVVEWPGDSNMAVVGKVQ